MAACRSRRSLSSAGRRGRGCAAGGVPVAAGSDARDGRSAGAEVRDSGGARGRLPATPRIDSARPVAAGAPWPVWRRVLRAHSSALASRGGTPLRARPARAARLGGAPASAVAAAAANRRSASGGSVRPPARARTPVPPGAPARYAPSRRTRHGDIPHAVARPVRGVEHYAGLLRAPPCVTGRGGRRRPVRVADGHRYGRAAGPAGPGHPAPRRTGASGGLFGVGGRAGAPGAAEVPPGVRLPVRPAVRLPVRPAIRLPVHPAPSPGWRRSPSAAFCSGFARRTRHGVIPQAVALSFGNGARCGVLFAGPTVRHRPRRRMFVTELRRRRG